MKERKFQCSCLETKKVGDPSNYLAKKHTHRPERLSRRLYTESLELEMFKHDFR
jgi:hypothetical protein